MSTQEQKAVAVLRHYVLGRNRNGHRYPPSIIRIAAAHALGVQPDRRDAGDYDWQATRLRIDRLADR